MLWLEAAILNTNNYYKRCSDLVGFLIPIQALKNFFIKTTIFQKKKIG
jgi:hypothetical protein